MKIFALLLIVAVSIALYCFSNRTYWILDTHNHNGVLAITIRESSGKRIKTAIFEDIPAKTNKPVVCRLPEETGKLEGARQEFYDGTISPGFIQIAYQEHVFKIMEKAVFVNNEEHLWNSPKIIRLKSPKDTGQMLTKVYMVRSDFLSPQIKSDSTEVSDASEFLSKAGLEFSNGSFAVFDPSTAQLTVRNKAEYHRMLDILISFEGSGGSAIDELPAKPAQTHP